MSEKMTAIPFLAWVNRNEPKEQMYWRDPALRQYKAMLELCEDLQTQGFSPPVVAATHNSKSIALPVIKMEKPGLGCFLLRDNFHSVNVCFLLSSAPKLAPADLFGEPLTWEWYLGVVERARGYSYKGWTEEEMADPRILRVWVKHDHADTGYWSERRGEEKDRWARRLVDTSWYTSDWSSGRLHVEGEMGPGCAFYVAEHPFCEGIERVVPPKATECWSAGARSFTVATDWEGARRIIPLVFGTVTPASPSWECVEYGNDLDMDDVHIEAMDWIWRDAQGRVRRQYGFSGGSSLKAHTFGEDGTCLEAIELRDVLPAENLRDGTGVWPHARTYTEGLDIE